MIDTPQLMSRHILWLSTCCHVPQAVTDPRGHTSFVGTPLVCVFGGGASEPLVRQLPSRHSAPLHASMSGCHIMLDGELI